MLLKLVLTGALLLALGCASTKPAEEQEGELSDGCHSPLGFIPEGRSATGYLNQVEHGQSCQQGTLTCEDGVWSGAYIYPSCIRSGN